MALPTFTPIVAPSPGTQIKPTVKVLEADFGDGYSQPTPDGINHIRKTVTLQWDALTPAQKNSIESFFEARKGTEAFYYKPAGFAATMKWTCKEWEFKSDGVFSANATLVQSFTNAT